MNSAAQLGASTSQLERFRALITRRMGLAFEEHNVGFLSDAFAQRLAAVGVSALAYLDALEHGPAAEVAREVAELAKLVTVNETYFFRNIEQFNALVEVVLPARTLGRSTPRIFRALSLGCASGEEAYTLAMLLQGQLRDGWTFSLQGVDVNPNVIERAKRARFSSWALRETPQDVRDRFFEVSGRELVLKEHVRKSVSFECRNLSEPQPDLFRIESCDVVFCRNMLMYFELSVAQRVVAQIARALAPGGYLFLGHAENLRGVSQDFELCHSHNTFYYRRKAEHVALVPTDQRAPATLLMAAGETSGSMTRPAAALSALDDTWFSSIQAATDRITALTQLGRGAATVPEPVRRASWDLTSSFELLKRERFGEALDHVNALPHESEHDADVLLLRAALLTHSGQNAEAELVCKQLLQVDALNAGAHYLIALCREGAGDRSGAVDHAQTAAYLDAAFAMPRLHLGLLARRSGDRDTAQRELSQALTLLQREDAARVLLFGGGFGREALISLCQAELQRSGGSP